MSKHSVARIVAAMLITCIVGGWSAQLTEARAAKESAVRLNGRPSSVAIATRHHCHDGVRETLECFTSTQERDASWRLASLAKTPMSSGGYVIAWVGASYTGSSVVLSQDYSNLGSIGWNDRISAYKVYTSLTGAFYEHSNYWGLTQFFCCFSQVSYVGDAYNDKFSSINLP